MTEVEAPQNVRLELRDGRTISCDLDYAGMVDGVHRWVITPPVALDEIASLRADTMPGHSAIVIGGTR